MNTDNWMVAAVVVGALLIMAIYRRYVGKASTQEDPLLKLDDKLERLERELRYAISESSRTDRQELSQNMAQLQQTLTEQLAFIQTTLNTQLLALGEGNARRMGEVRDTLDKQLQQLQQTNAAKLDEMRQTVDEKLQTTLEARLSESFKQVAERLEQVHQGLGHMKTLAQGVGDLQRVLSNVKTRGIFGEVQLEALLEQVLCSQ